MKDLMLYWSFAVWCIGAVVITAALTYVLIWGINDGLAAMGRKMQKARYTAWVWSALYEYSKKHPPQPKNGIKVREPRDFIATEAQYLIGLCEKHGYVLTIHTEPKLYKTPAMGDYDMVAEVRESRARYMKEGEE